MTRHFQSTLIILMLTSIVIKAVFVIYLQFFTEGLSYVYYSYEELIAYIATVDVELLFALIYIFIIQLLSQYNIIKTNIRLME